MTANPTCSFCSVTLRELAGGKMIAGPSVYICGHCVQLCAEVLAKSGTSLDVVGGAADTLATMAVDLEASRSRVRTLESAIKSVAQTVARVMPGPHAITCMWCDAALGGDSEAREHVASCDKHPAVIALRAHEAAP